ncbi:porin [Xylophilus sp. Leaf220]|uniref:porin n=1 Tax=Xylophilus sp. Leaf220 TaxID=1735686 RepID=UPI0009E7CC0C|nr:porin [Xylophilus sp. Leaf220]
MKKALIAVAALVACTAGMAQSSVTLFGTLDAGVGRLKSSGTSHVTGLLNGGNSTSRLGFRGTEDLGGGLSAGFWLEGALNNDVGGGSSQTGGFDFQRRSTVSLFGTFGEVRLGRDFVASYPMTFDYDVSGQRGFEQVEILGMSTSGVTGVSAFRTSNSVSYLLPSTLGGFFGQVQYGFGEGNSSVVPVANAAGISTSAAAAATKKTGNYMGVRGGYGSGPFKVSASYGQYSDATRVVGASAYASDFKVANIGASYDFGIVKPMGFIQTDKIGGRGAIAAFQFNTYAIGATAPVGPGLIRVQASHYTQDNSSNGANKVSLGYVHNLSPRTALYADVARLNNKGASTYQVGGVGGLSNNGPVAGGNSTGIAIGMKHSF